MEPLGWLLELTSGAVHTVEMYGSDWRWRAGADSLSRIAFVEGDLELIN